MLTKKEQLEILQTVMERYETEMYSGCHYGLCYYIIAEIENKHGINLMLKDITNYIPLFTAKNASHFQSRNSELHNYWWKLGDVNRIMFLQWMINELSGKNNNFLKWVKNILS